MEPQPIDRDSTKQFETILLGRLKDVRDVTRVTVSYRDIHPMHPNQLRAIVTVELDADGLEAEVRGAVARLARDCDFLLRVLDFTNGGGVIFTKPTLLESLTRGPKSGTAATTLVGSVTNFVLNHQKEWVPLKVVRGEDDPDVPGTWDANVQTTSGKWFRVFGTVDPKRELYQVMGYEPMSKGEMRIHGIVGG